MKRPGGLTHVLKMYVVLCPLIFLNVELLCICMTQSDSQYNPKFSCHEVMECQEVYCSKQNKKNVNAVRSTPNFIFRGCQDSTFVLNKCFILALLSQLESCIQCPQFTREHVTLFQTRKSTEREKLELEYVSQIKLNVTLLNVY